MSRPRILVIGAGEFQLPLVQEAARECDVLLAAPEVPDDFLPHVKEILTVDVRDEEAILSFARGRGIDGVATDQTDIAVRSVAFVAERLRLPGIGYETGRLFTDKSLMRERLEELGVPQLPNRTVRSLGEALSFYHEIGGEVIVKPLDSQGSRGVQACRDADELAGKYDEAARWSSAECGHAVIVERLARGREFVVEGLACGGSFVNLCIGDTHYFDAPDVFAASSRVFPTVADDALRDRVLALNERIVRGFGLSQGIAHSEFIMDGGEVYLMETAARGGGVFISSDLVHLSSGLRTEKFIVGAALGRIGSLEDAPGLEGRDLSRLAVEPLCCCAYIAFFVPAGRVVSVEGAAEVRGLPYVHRHQIGDLESFVGRTSSVRHVDKTTRRAIIVSAPSRAVLRERIAVIKELLRVTVELPDGRMCGLQWA